MKAILFLLISFLGFSTLTKAQFTLEPLPYGFDALEPYIDARTMEIHYTKHHAGYVANLNLALVEAGLDHENSLLNILGSVSSYNAAIRNNAGGHYNHTFFWKILTPQNTVRPSEKFQKAIESTFGSMEDFKNQLRKEAISRFGSGWAWLVVTPDKKLAILSTPNQDNPLMDDSPIKGVPVLGIDVWEHAYYLKYQNRRADYLDAIWNVINWAEVSRLYGLAVK